MFGGDLVLPKYNKRTRPNPMRYDIQFPSIHSGHYQHIAREPNTDYHVQCLHYKQRRNAADNMREGADKKQSQNVIAVAKYDKHAEKKHVQRLIKEKVQKKINEYEGTIEMRREKLQDLLYKEERQFYAETIDKAQKGDETKMEDMKRQAEILRAKNEAERLGIVHKKRLEQYRQRCLELRPFLLKKSITETKNTQLQQIRENEAKREEERELEKMWHHLMTREIQAKMEREEQSAIKEKRNQLDLVRVWDMQVKGKELLKKETEKVAEEDRIELEKLAEQLRQEKREAHEAKVRKRDATTKELMDQIEAQEILLAQRKKEEDALNEAFSLLAEMELEKERQAIKDTTTQAKRESLLYRRNLKELQDARKREEKELDELLAMYKKEIEAKQDEARCKILEAKQELQRSVMEGRANQLGIKRQEAQDQLRLKEAENELIRLAFDRNKCLQEESDRLEKEAIRQYRDDLQTQIEYNNLLRRREREELERQLEEGRREEEKYRKIVQDTMQGSIQFGVRHPFRGVVEQYDCSCPPQNTK